jgi:raffinose/stachyose/melibiose transport system substrate-binding protein
MFNGDWESGTLDKQVPGNVGFFVMPPAQQGGQPAAMSAPLTFGISSRAKHADCAAFFLNWVASNVRARDIAVQIGGSHPMGPADAHMPAVKQSTVTASTLDAATQISKGNGAMDFIANATGAIYAKGWTPQLQKLVAGQQTPDGLLKSVQSDYESQVGG